MRELPPIVDRDELSEPMQKLLANLGHLASMANILRDGIRARRIEQTQAVNIFTNGFGHSYNEAIVRPEISKLRVRVSRVKMVKDWDEESAALAGPKRLKEKEFRRRILNKVGKEGRVAWKTLQKNTTRARIWSNICEIFRPDLGEDSCVALCAITMENSECFYFD
jgi:hypothetical protein